jgi:hypothetical protein
MVDLLLESALRSLALGGAVWLGLTLLRVRNPRTEMTAWTVVLAVAVAMPALMDRLTVTLPSPALHAVEQLSAPSGHFSAPLAELTEVPAPPVQGSDRPDFDWRTLAAAIYLAVAGVMLLRLVTGVLLSFRIARAARPLREGWARGGDVRVSDAVATPVMFGSTVLLPAAYAGWSEAKRQAVLSHELSHVAHGDFYVLLLARFHRAVFWFNPMAWWQLVRMEELTEIISDDAALEMLDDRPFYAGILLDLAAGRREAPVAAIAMARVATLCKRVERILAGTAVPARIGWRKRAVVALVLAPAVFVAAGAVGSGAVRPLAASAPDAETEIERQIEEGKLLQAAGNLSLARGIFLRLAQAGNPHAALLYAESYDPISLAKRQLWPPDSDLALARIWYRKAYDLGSPEAKARLERLSAWLDADGPGAATPPAAGVEAVPAASAPGADAASAEPHPLDRYAGYFEIAPNADSSSPLQLVAESASQGTDSRLPLGIFVLGPRELASAATVEIIGLPSGWVLSAGQPLGDRWRIPAAHLSGAVILPPRRFSGEVDLEVELRLADDTLVERRSVHWAWAKAEPKLAPADPAPEKLAPEKLAPAKLAAKELAPEKLAAAKLAAADTTLLLREAERLLAQGDFASARRLLRVATDAGSVRAALLLAETCQGQAAARHRYGVEPHPLDRSRSAVASPDINSFNRAAPFGREEAQRSYERELEMLCRPLICTDGGLCGAPQAPAG